MYVLMVVSRDNRFKGMRAAMVRKHFSEDILNTRLNITHIILCEENHY